LRSKTREKGISDPFSFSLDFVLLQSQHFYPFGQISFSHLRSDAAYSHKQENKLIDFFYPLFKEGYNQNENCIKTINAYLFFSSRLSALLASTPSLLLPPLC